MKIKFQNIDNKIKTKIICKTNTTQKLILKSEKEIKTLTKIIFNTIIT